MHPEQWNTGVTGALGEKKPVQAMQAMHLSLQVLQLKSHGHIQCLEFNCFSAKLFQVVSSQFTSPTWSGSMR